MKPCLLLIAVGGLVVQAEAQVALDESGVRAGLGSSRFRGVLPLPADSEADARLLRLRVGVSGGRTILLP